MLNKLTEVITNLRRLGVRPEQSLLEQERIRLLNDTVLMIFCVEFIFLIIQLNIFSINEFLRALLRFGFSLSILICHYFHKIRLARFCFIIPIPLILMFTLMNVGDFPGIMLAFIVFPAVIFILISKRNERILFVGYVVALYLIGSYYNDIYPATIERADSPLAEWITFCLLVSIAFTFIDRFTRVNSQVLNQLEELGVSSKETNQELQINKVKIAKRQAQLEDYNKELENFAYIASHDLKTPLRNISSFLKLIQRKLRNHSDTSVLEYLDFASNSAKQMHYLVEDILEFSRLGDQSLLITRVDMNEVFKNVQRNLINVIEEKNAKVVAPNDLPIVQANETQLVLLFQNFIENGLKYNKSEVPTVTILNESNNDWVIIHFQDNGLGIPEEYRATIFEMFKRLHNQSEYQGSGVGLAICKKIVEQYKGTITVSQPTEGGSIFTIKMPRRNSKEATS